MAHFDLPNPMRSFIFLNSFNFRCPVVAWGATKRFSLLHWQDIVPTVDMLWQDVDKVDWEPEDTEVLPLPPNRSTLDKPIFNSWICLVHSNWYSIHSFARNIPRELSSYSVGIISTVTYSRSMVSQLHWGDSGALISSLFH